MIEFATDKSLNQVPVMEARMPDVCELSHFAREHGNALEGWRTIYCSECHGETVSDICFEIRDLAIEAFILGA